MTSVEQRKMVQRLRQVIGKMKSEDRRAFEMMAKRDRDDEELDVLAMTKLKDLYIKFYPGHSKNSLEEKWKKFTGGE